MARRHHGGITGLARLLTDEWGPLEADFTRYYGADLRMACWGPTPWSARRLLNHIRQLPPDSAYQRSVRGERADWDQQAELLATVVDRLGALSYYLLRVNGNDPREPDPFPRPGHVTPEIPTVSLKALASFLKEG